MLVLLPWQFHMNVHRAIFQFEVFFIEFRLRADLDRDNIPFQIASQAGEPITIFNRDPTGVVKAEIRLDVNLPIVRKVHITLEDGEIIKVAIFYLGFPSATCRSCYVFNHNENYCGMIANVAWMAVPVLNLQGVDPFEEQVEELVQVIQQNMDIQNGDGAQANQEPVIEAENNFEEVNEAGADNIALNVDENDTEVSKNQNDEGNEEVNKEIIVDIGVDNSANGTYVSEINRFDLRTNKRRMTEDVILEAMEMEGYIQ